MKREFWNERREAPQLEAEFLESGQLYSLSVTLSLGDVRDVLLGLKDPTRYDRRDSAFRAPQGLGPVYTIKQSTHLFQSSWEQVIQIDYPAGTPSDNRLFFNLKGHGVGNIEDHNLWINADAFWGKPDRADGDGGDTGTPRADTDVGDTETPKADGVRSGRFGWLPVEGSPLDFREETPIGERIRMGYRPLVERKGYDHIFRLKRTGKEKDGLCLAAALSDHARTLSLEVYTDFPALYFYTGNGFSGKDIGKGGCIYPKRGGVLLAPVDWPLVDLSSERTGEDAAKWRGGRVEYRFRPLAQEFAGGVKGR